MKYTKILALVILVCFASTLLNAQEKSIDTLIHKLFSSLKQQDEKAFIALYPNGQQFAYIMRPLIEDAFKSNEMKGALASNEKTSSINIDSLIEVQMNQVTAPQVEAELSKKYSQLYHEFIEKGEKKGVKWQEAELISISLDSTLDKSDTEVKSLLQAGMKTMKGIVDFRSNKVNYRMTFAKFVNVPQAGGWFSGEIKEIVRKAERPRNIEQPSLTLPSNSKTKKKDTHS
ncbi:hypothetical protein [Flavisolibacter ginsenosidimutans]|uniref:Uncharacterized protein n=1 Tax=Flavisolibacter ginsenosidimutans TaxID=661481 RepID=A0A5B8ULK7_9BACT|nr:hypothetical protein [Flavisolibacter ginsenosidimutans]QEC57453.1 hypothetical protein FSB75_16610 [Flavisolibacter ginsenosidimutans]